MRTFAPFRIAMHSAMYFAAASLTAVFAGCIALPFAALFAVLLLSLVAAQAERPIYRFLIVLPSALCLLLADGPVPALVACVPIIYGLFLITLGRYYMERWQFQNEIKFSGFLMLLLISATLLIGYSLKEENRIPLACTHSSWALLFCAFVFAVIAMRSIRIGTIRSGRWHAGNIGFFLLPIGAACLFGFVLLYVVWPIIKYVGFGISSGFILLLGGLGNVLSELWGAAKNIDFGDEISTLPPMTAVPDPDVPFSEPTPESDFFPSLVPRTKIDFLLIGVILLAAAIVVVLVLLISKARSGKDGSHENGVREYGVYEAEKDRNRQRKRRRTKAFSNAEKVRAVYRRYLAFLHTYGIVPAKSATSGEITEDSLQLIIETDEELRALYRKARYGGGEITDEEVRQAEELLDRIAANENLKK